MKTYFPLLLLFLFSSSFCYSQKTITVFTSGTEGHKSYRIPAIIRLPNQELLAFCEGRVNGGADFGDINIVMKKSSDNGNTWSNIQTIVDYDSLQAGNPAPVVDLTDSNYPQGRIFLFYNTGNNTEWNVRNGKGYREVWYKTSTDGGATWNEAVNITLQVHKPKQPQISAAYNFTEDWRCYANTPGHAMQFTTGKLKGRIYVAANHSSGEPKQGFEDYKAHGFYTDDHSKTFSLSQPIPIEGSNESTATEIANDKLLLNSRNQKGHIKARIVSISSNGGATWDTSYFDKNLPDPICQGSILHLETKKGKSIIAFCNAADTAKRDNLTLRISYNNGLTWKKHIVIDSTGKANNSAYSDIVQLSKKEIGILYEKDNYSRIVFVRVRWR